MMKKVTAILGLLLFAVSLCAPRPTEARSVRIASGGLYAILPLHFYSTMNVVDGSLPQFTDTSDADLAERVNDLVARFYDEIMISAQPLSDVPPNPDIMFSYDVFETEKYLSVVLHGSVNPGNTASDVVRTIVLDQKTDKLYTLPDILGKGAYAAAQEFVAQAIRAHPDQYLQDVKIPRVDVNTSFYINGAGDLVFIFDKYAIAPGASGTPEIVYPLAQRATGIHAEQP